MKCAARYTYGLDILLSLCLLLLLGVQNLVRCENKCKENSEVDRTATERTS